MKSIMNIKIMKCYKALFTKKRLIKNIGSYIISTVIFIYLISYNVFFMVEYDKLVDIIDKIIKNKLYNKKQCNNIQNTMNLQNEDINKNSIIDIEKNKNKNINKNLNKDKNNINKKLKDKKKLRKSRHNIIPINKNNFKKDLMEDKNNPPKNMNQRRVSKILENK